MGDSTQLDYGILDRVGIGRMIFYPRRDLTPPPAGAIDYRVPVEAGVEIACRFYPVDPALPTVLYFHGNGEVVPDYDQPAGFFHQARVNLWVADYRGYGASSGTPTFAALVGDAHRVLDHVDDILDSSGFHPSRYVMGRSLGTHPALELAARRADRLKGLIIESGGANLRRLFRLFGGEPPDAAAGLIEQHAAKVAAIALPSLIIHGEYDELIPVENALELHETLQTEPKSLLIVPGAGHNDILWIGLRPYFQAIHDFVAATK